ncbi:unnamed protein product [marine sediment metagenome]|uniref:Uncharacterized protein n=1 Tax=marine sediment metagenome TaxID=412755 RepID=X1K8P4_9ZZZZ
MPTQRGVYSVKPSEANGELEPTKPSTVTASARVCRATKEVGAWRGGLARQGL